MSIETVGITRTLQGNDGDIEHFTSVENNMNETMQQLLFKAPYDREFIGKYALLDDAYRASGGFEDGRYIIPHPRENGDKYRRRQQLAYFTNYVKPVVDGCVNPIFKVKPVRQNTSALYDIFLNDVDGNHTTLDRFMKKAAIRAKLHGVEFIVIDMEQIDRNTVITEKDVIDNRLYPYLYLISPAQVVDWSVDKFGKLLYISYYITTNTIDEKGNKKIITETYTWTQYNCKKSSDKGEEIINNEIGVIPIVPLYGSINDSGDLIPQSDIYAIARTNLSIYNACSELRERNRNQAFSILAFPIDPQDDYDSDVPELKTGTADCLLYKSGSASPEFITPPSGPSDTLMEEINFLIKEIYRMANMQMTTGVNQYNVSGLAKEWDNQQLFQTISELSRGLQEVEYRLAHIFSLYTSESMDNLSIIYNMQFGIVDTTSLMSIATQGLAMDICPNYNIEMKKQVIRATLKDVDNNLVEDVINNLMSLETAGSPVNATNSISQTPKIK